MIGFCCLEDKDSSKMGVSEFVFLGPSLFSFAVDQNSDGLRKRKNSIKGVLSLFFQVADLKI